MKRTLEEYGGFLPLELNKGKEYYQYAETQLQRFNCGKAAVAHVIECLAPKTIYVPYYLCPNVCKEIESHDSEVRYYHINEKLMPAKIPDDDGNCIYLVNYFGIMDKAIAEYANHLKKAKVVIDNCHSFYCEPIMAWNFYNIYSCKKFFGVPDGAYLIASHLDIHETEKTYSSKDAVYLLESLEYGTNYCYAEKKKVDQKIASKYEGMSVLARCMLEGIDYKTVKEKRHDNFLQYERAFGDINLFDCEQSSVPYIYPLNVGRNIKSQLIKEKIYVPTLWGHMLEEKFKGSFEYKISDETLFLPLDQRYGKEDLEYIIERVKCILADNKSV